MSYAGLLLCFSLDFDPSKGSGRLVACSVGVFHFAVIRESMSISSEEAEGDKMVER